MNECEDSFLHMTSTVKHLRRVIMSTVYFDWRGALENGNEWKGTC